MTPTPLGPYAALPEAYGIPLAIETFGEQYPAGGLQRTRPARSALSLPTGNRVPAKFVAELPQLSVFADAEELDVRHVGEMCLCAEAGYRVGARQDGLGNDPKWNARSFVVQSIMTSSDCPAHRQFLPVQRFLLKNGRTKF